MDINILTVWNKASVIVVVLKRIAKLRIARQQLFNWILQTTHPAPISSCNNIPSDPDEAVYNGITGTLREKAL